MPGTQNCEARRGVVVGAIAPQPPKPVLPNLEEVLSLRVRQLRLEAGWSQDQLSGKAMVWGLRWTRTTVADIEARRRRVSLKEFFVLSHIFRTPMLDVSTLLARVSSFIDVQFVNAQEDLQARDRALAVIGLTYEQLKEQAATNDFVSERARALWDAFGELTPV